MIKNDSRNDRNRRRSQAGLTLIEMLVVVTILGLFLSYVGLKYWKHVDEARVTTARAQINAFKDALLTYRLQHGTFPTTEQGIAALAGELNGDIPKDPWGNAYQYKYPGEHGDEPEIMSYGADGQAGGEGINADIVSWKTQ